MMEQLDLPLGSVPLAVPVDFSEMMLRALCGRARAELTTWDADRNSPGAVTETEAWTWLTGPHAKSCAVCRAGLARYRAWFCGRRR